MDRIMEVLSKQQRREILYRLKRDDRLEPFQGPDALDSSEIELYHVHLPKLEAAGYIDWNRETGAVMKGPQYDEVETFLTLIENHADEVLVTDDE
ncbi:ArsR family transcriptional regulator (plasmid) [Haloplanus rubicundus]|uniref:ArsR family transcriptional regulator n=1 Tax=Haloplanus rubicundus TaxID=1547898 RepID=A0A345E8J4_9EURY|nr:ArsR family transcriptional regulator [Haloplanus rubicundus]